MDVLDTDWYKQLMKEKKKLKRILCWGIIISSKYIYNIVRANNSLCVHLFLEIEYKQ